MQFVRLVNKCVFMATVMLVALMIGCEKRRHREEVTLAVDDSRFVLAIVLDLSRSFSQLMAEDGKGYEFALLVIDQYFRDRIGTRDKVIIAQISGTKRSPLWEGTPTELRQQFPNAEAFRKFLMRKADPSRSYVHEGVTQVLDYVMADPSVSNGKAKSAMFVLSDMLDSGAGPSSRNSKQKVIDTLTKYGQGGGIVGLYYVDLGLVPEWRQILQDAGLKHCTVQSDIVGKPMLPTFE